MSNEVKPITPKEVIKKIEEAMPSFVFEVVNKLITDELIATNSSECAIKQNDIIKALIAHQEVKGVQITRDEIFEKGWLNFEPHYKKAGWKVRYDRPSYNDSYDAYFEFSVK